VTVSRFKHRPWVMLPSNWILTGNGLIKFNQKLMLADNIMALMCLIVIAHKADIETGRAQITYDEFEIALNKSRSLISRGLKVLLDLQIVSKGLSRSEYLLESYDLNLAHSNQAYRWAKFPCSHLYSGSRLDFFADLTLRGKAELDALKLMLLFAALRDNHTNLAMVSYDTIVEKTGIIRERIKRALSLLSINGIITTETRPTSKSAYGVAHGYRLIGISPYQHSGTSLRGETSNLTTDAEDLL
jgi:hypothetical protein